MKIYTDELGRCVIDGEQKTFLYADTERHDDDVPQTGAKSILPEGSVVIEGFGHIPMHCYHFGSFWNIKGRQQRYLYDTSDNGVAFLDVEKQQMIIVSKDEADEIRQASIDRFLRSINCH